MGISLCLLTACDTEKKVETQTLSKFPVTNPILIDTTFVKEYVADIQSIQNVELRAKTKGSIEKIWVDEGKMVAAGQTIYSINNAGLKIELKKAESQIKTILAEEKTLEIELENTRKLVDKNIVAKSEQAMIEAKIGATEAKINEIKTDIEGIKLQMSFSQIKAPFSGVINRHILKAGAMVEDGTALTTISNNNQVFVYFNVSEREYLDFISKKKSNNDNLVDLILANNELYPFKGNIETIEGEIDKNTGSIAFRAKFPNPNRILKHGSSGKIRLNQQLKGVMIIPQKSTFEVQDKTFIYVVNNKNVVEQKSIIPIARLDNLYIVEGVSLQDRILFEGIQNVKEGEKIEAELVNFRKAILLSLKSN